MRPNVSLKMAAKFLRAFRAPRTRTSKTKPLPENHIAASCSIDTRETEDTSRHDGNGDGGKKDGGMKDRAALHGDVLIVEDMMIIAMEAEDILRDAGAANCHVAASVAAALEFLDQKDLSFALLDVNLGIEVSEPVAKQLIQRSIPFVVASGYGDNNSGYPALSSAPSITKPYTMGQLHIAIALAFAKAGRGD